MSNPELSKICLGPTGLFVGRSWVVTGGADLLFYEGLHGAVITGDVNVAQHADLKIGVVPVIHLEWIQKIHRDGSSRGYSSEMVTDTILPDYVKYVCPQFSQTDINFQRIPTVDTSNPFIARLIPTPEESMVVIRFRNPRGFDFCYLLSINPQQFHVTRELHYSRRQARSSHAARSHPIDPSACRTQKESIVLRRSGSAVSTPFSNHNCVSLIFLIYRPHFYVEYISFAVTC
jgi:hypothetical protein